MATVFCAVDPSFEREVAVKILPRAFLHDDMFRARFEREAKTIAALEHGAIVPVYDFGEEDGQPYIVMRMMHGGSLGDKLEKGPIPLPKAVAILAQIAPALDSAHEKGIIHRDLKPGNILFDRYDNAYLSDFGIARVTEASHTLTGENVLGTPAYMSPEQVQGDKHIDGRSDLYAIGIVFFQMLTGAVPYQATTPVKVMMMHVLEPVPELASFMSDLPPCLELWFSKLLAKDPDDRFANGKEMIAALQAVVRGETHPTLTGTPRPTVVRTPQEERKPPERPDADGTRQGTPLPESKKRKRVPRVFAGIITALVLLTVVGIGYLALSSNGPLNITSRDQQATSPADREAFVGTAVKLTSDAYNNNQTQEVSSLAGGGTPGSESSQSTQPPQEVTRTVMPTMTTAASATAGSALPVIGGADKIAFLNENEIWWVNVDGTNLEQLTSDGAEKHDMSWDPNGERLYYISGRCIWYLEPESGASDYVACFEAAQFLEAFTISPNRERAGISLNRELYMIPFNEELLKEARSRSDLQEMSDCEAISPWMNPDGSARAVLGVHWTNTMEKISVLILINQGGIQAQVIQILDIGDCGRQPDRLDEFPTTRFQVDNYDNAPFLQNYTYDGGILYALTSYTRNDGYGHLYVYNSDLKKADVSADPINGQCCYRDPQFSPDGRYMVFAFQPFEIGATARLYLIPYATFGTGANYDPIPLPEDFFSDPKAKPEPVLRPAQD